MIGHVDPAALEVVVPVDPPEVASVGAVEIGVTDPGGVVERGRVGQLAEARQPDAPLAEALDAVRQRLLVDDAVGQPELVFERGGVGVGDRHA